MQKVITFDVETTGVDTSTDRVIELCIQTPTTINTWRFRPPIAISAEAEAVHGINIGELEECPFFADEADRLFPIFEEADVFIGYNVMFDISMISEEFERVGKTLDMSEKLIVDPYKLWQAMEPRKLTNAHMRFVGTELDGAHAADVDVIATRNTLTGMLDTWGLGDDWENLADICEPDRHKYVGITNHFLWNDEGQVVFGFGKHEGERAFSNQGYLKWMLGGTFPSCVKSCIKQMFDRTLKGPKA